MNSKPVLFLDFDRTLFDAEQFSQWLGADQKVRLERIISIVSGELPPPDFLSMLFADTCTFLKEARKTHRLVILTFSKNVRLQRLKLKESGVTSLVDDIIITGGSKEQEADNYLKHVGEHGWRNVFIDDDIGNIVDMKNTIPSMQCLWIQRGGEFAMTDSLAKEKVDAPVRNLDEALSAIRLG